MTTVMIEVPDELVEQFDSLDDVRKTVYEDFIVIQRQIGNISLGRAAELLGMTYSKFFELLGQKGLPVINATGKELDESYQRFENVMSLTKS